jgi:hypothetical protein
MNIIKNKNFIIIFIIIIFIIIFIIYNTINYNKKKYIIDNFYNFNKKYYENINYQYDAYNYGDLEYTTPLECNRHFKFMVDPNLPNTKGCYIKLDDMKKYYNPYLKNCPDIWNYNIEIDGVQYCRKDGSNLPLVM